jgi:hypothetical protein
MPTISSLSLPLLYILKNKKQNNKNVYSLKQNYIIIIYVFETLEFKTKANTKKKEKKQNFIFFSSYIFT